MALSRIWFHQGNIPFPAVSTPALVAKSLFWLIKASLKNEVLTGTNGPEGAAPSGSEWTCLGSSDAVTAGLDNIDRLDSTFDASKIVRAAAGVPHSWIVLKSPDVLGPYYMCVDYASAADNTFTVYVSKTAFTGGTIINRPVSSTEWIALAGVSTSGATGAHNFQKIVDADGNFYLTAGQVGTGFQNWTMWGSRLEAARPSDSNDFFTLAQFLNSGRGAPQMATVDVNGRTQSGSANISGGLIRMTAQGITIAGASAVNAADSTYDTIPAYVWSTNVAGSGCRGFFPDAGMIGNPAPGSSSPTVGPQEQFVVGDFVIPGSVIIAQ